MMTSPFQLSTFLSCAANVIHSSIWRLHFSTNTLLQILRIIYFLDQAFRLIRKLQNWSFVSQRLLSSLKKFVGRHLVLVDKYMISIFQLRRNVGLPQNLCSIIIYRTLLTLDRLSTTLSFSRVCVAGFFWCITFFCICCCLWNGLYWIKWGFINQQAKATVYQKGK